jgi:fatty-acyl-CoA synthase
MTRAVVASLLGTIGRAPNSVGIRALDPDGVVAILTYGELQDAALRIAGGFARMDIGRGDRVIVSMPTCVEFFCVYLACLTTGIIPAIVAPPRAPGTTANGVGAAVAALGARCVIVREPSPAADADARPSRIAARSLMASSRADNVDSTGGGDIAHLQGTSGTTSTPRWAVVRHGNIGANVRAIAEVVGRRDDDVLVTWLPMSHDMGLIGVCYAWYWGIPLVAADPRNFVRNPLSWLELISQYRGTLSSAPNSAYQACARIAKLRPPTALKLGHWRVAFCGAEPVHEATLTDFHRTFGPFGLRREVLRPVYGLAEATLAVTLSPPTRPFNVEYVDAATCPPGSDVAPGGRGAEVAIVGCGRVVPGHELRIVDDAGRPVGEGTVGEIEVRGASVVDGYFGVDNVDCLKREGFLCTGDLGYLRDGELFVTGRTKEMLIINGRNFSPLQIEAVLEKELGAAFTPAAVAVEAPDDELKSGALHILLDSRLGVARDTEVRVRRTLEDSFGLRGVSLHWVIAGHIPRTTSGKIQRYRCRELIRRDGIGSDGSAAAGAVAGMVRTTL